jgi:hypothetical protein
MMERALADSFLCDCNTSHTENGNSCYVIDGGERSELVIVHIKWQFSSLVFKRNCTADEVALIRIQTMPDLRVVGRESVFCCYHACVCRGGGGHQV